MGDAKGGEPDLIQRCLVYCRLRPTKPNELNEKEGVYKLVELHKQIIKVGEEKTYTFDGTFNPDGTQEEIFQIVARPSVEHIIKGYNAAIMAYGQTGTGKSFTMSNFKPGQEGIIPRSAGHLFELIESTPTKTFSLSANFVQIYRDKLTDLMDEKQPKVDIRFSKEKGVELVGCTTVQIGSKEDFMAMYQEGDARRVVRPTKMNPESSRGHTALVLYIDVKPNDPNDMSRPATGKITFIDLAGYERFDKTGIKATAGNEHLVDEAKKINSSLLSLGHVVSALSSGDKHIPWRDSKLTMLLQDSIGGKSRSTIMITIGPASNHFHETTNSLGFGNRAMAIKSVAKQEVEVDFQKLAAKLQAEIDEKDAKIDSLEKTAKQREAERLNIEARSVRDTSRLRQRHADELKQLMEEGATVERIQKLLDAHEVEDSNLQEEQFEEREFVKEREEEEDRETIKTIDQQHRVRAASIKREVSQAKQKELDAAYALIAQLRGVTDIAEIAKEIAELAGTPSPSDEAGGEPEEAASPRTANHAEVAILQREIGEMKLKAEADVQKMSQTKAAHLKCANLLKEAREQNKILLKESVNVEQLQKLEGEVEELKTAKAAAHEHYTELEDKLENTRKQLYAVQAEHTALAHKQAHAEKEGKELLEKLDTVEAEKSELAAKLEAAEAEKNELGEEFNRKQREREAETEHLGAESKRQAGEFSKEIEDLQAKVAALEAQISDLEAANKALEAKIEEKEAAITEKEAEIQRGLETVREKEQELASLQEDRQEEQEAARKRERELEKACEQCRDETRTTSVQLQQEIEEMQAGTALHVSTLLEKLNLLNSQLDANRAEVEQTKASGESQAVKLDEVEQSLAQAEARLGEAERTIEAKDAEVEAAAAAIREKETEVESLQAKLDETLSRAEQGESEGKQLQELARERDQLTQQASAEAAALQAQLEERDAELQNLRAELEKEKLAGADGAAKLEETAQGATEAGARLEEASRSIAEKEASLREAAAACEAKEEELRGVAGEAETLREQLAAAAARADEAEEKGQTLQTQLQDATRQLEASQQESAELRTQLDERVTHLEGLRAELEDALKKIEAHEVRMEEVADDLQSKEGTLQQSAEVLQSKEAELASLGAELADFKAKLDDMTSQAEASSKRGQCLDDQLQEVHQRAGEESSELQKQLEESAQQLKTVTEDNERATTEITEYQEKTAGLNAELSERTAAVEAGQEKISDLEGALEDASVREAALNRELSQLREELAAKEEALAEYADREKAGEEEKGDLNRQLQAASAGKSEGDERLGALTEELSAVKEQSAAVEASLADVNRQLADTANELTAVTDRLAASEASLAEQKEGFAALQQASSGETASLLSQLATANSSLEEARGERDAVAAAKAQEVAALQQESSSLIQDRDELKAQLGKSTDDLSRLRAECEELKAKLDEQVVTTEDLAQQLKDAEESLAVAKEDLENEKAALEEAKEEHELSEAELADFKETAEADMQRLKAEKEEMEKQHTETTTSLEEELANTIQLTEALEKRIKELEDKIFELQGTLDTEKTNAQLELEGLKKKSVEERKLREEEVASGRAARDALKAQMQQELEEEKKKKTGGKFKYKSKLVSQLAGVGQVGTAPANAPAVNLRPADILASLDLEEVKASLRYKLIIVGANGTGKSSVFKCMTAEGSSLMKKLPEVLSPTPAVTCVDYVYRERKEGFLSKARSGAATYFEVWDTPCDPRVLASLPNGCLPVTGCCYVVTFLLPNDIGQEGKKMEDALRHVYASCKKMHEAARSAAAKDAVEKKRKPPGLRIAVLLVGTKRDGVSSSKDSSAVSKKIADAKRWFRDCLIAKENFSLVDCVAVSCKDWTATYDSNRTSSHSINGLVGVVAGELARLYPNTPPALLAPGTFSSGDAVEVPEWYAAVQEVHSEKQRLDVARWKSVLSLVVQLGRLRRRNVWLMGSQEYETMLSDHIPSHVVASHPNTLRQFIDAFVFRGLATPPIHDVENHPDDPRESFVIIGQTMLVRVIGAALWLPSVYLSQLDSFATEPPGYLKNVVVKSTAFNVEEVWRPDWELMFDGKYSSTAADKLLKRSKAFEKDPPLGYKFLQCLGLAFNMKYTSTPDAQICYAPCIALSSLVTDLESLFLALYKKNSDGWEAATAKSITPMSPLELLLLQKELYEANEGKNVHFWGNGVAVGRPVEGGSIRWGYVKVSGTATTVCCEGKTNNVMPYLRGLVEKFAGSGSGGRLDWFEGMSLDHLPSLPPSMVQKVAAAESFGQFVEAMPPKQTRGSTYPATALDNDLKKWGRGSKAAGSKIDASRLALFEERV